MSLCSSVHLKPRNWSQHSGERRQSEAPWVEDAQVCPLCKSFWHPEHKRDESQSGDANKKCCVTYLRWSITMKLSTPTLTTPLWTHSFMTFHGDIMKNLKFTSRSQIKQYNKTINTFFCHRKNVHIGRLWKQYDPYWPFTSAVVWKVRKST